MSPSSNHAYLQAKLAAAFVNLDQYSVYSELSLEISGKEYVPDIAIFQDRKPNYRHDEIKVTEIPILVIEILSPSQKISEIVEDKFPVYFQAGIQSCWSIEPYTQAISIWTPTEVATFSKGKVVDSVLNITIPVETIFK